MNVLDLLVDGIEAQMSNEDSFTHDAITFRFRKGERYYQRILTHKEILEFQGGGAISSSLLEDYLCREVLAYFKGLEKPNGLTLKLNDIVICEETKVIGRVIKFYTPTASEEQIMVETRSGRHYHAPARLWKHYQFGLQPTTVIVDEMCTTQPLLNQHGQYAAKFAENHGMSINEALEHPTVKAHAEYLSKASLDEKVLKETYPKQNFLKNGG